MKNFTMMSGLLLLAGAAQAQVTSIPGAQYREQHVKIEVLTGEVKIIVLQTNVELEVVAHGEPWIEDHGFYDYNVTGTIIEDGKRCKFSALMAQGKLNKESTDQIIRSDRDRSASIILCSGLRLEMNSTKNLMMGETQKANLKAPGLSQPIGSGNTIPKGLKTVPQRQLNEDIRE